MGIIPHIVPGKPVPDCSGAAGAASATECVLGSSAGWSLAASPSAVTRPTGGADDQEVAVTLMGKGFISTGTVAATAALDLHASVAGVSLGTADGAAPATGEAGVLKWTVDVAADADRCASTNPDRLTAQTVTVEVATVAEVIPGLPTDGVEATFTVNCAAESSASQGVELAPGNPFPVD